MFKQKRQWILLAIFIAVLGVGWVVTPMSIKYQIGKTLGIHSPALGTGSKFMDLSRHPNEIKKFYEEENQKKEIKQYIFPIKVKGNSGQVNQYKLDPSEKSGAILIIDGQVLLSIESSEEKRKEIAKTYPRLAKYLYPTETFNEIVITTKREATKDEIKAGLASGYDSIIKWAAKKISKLQPREAYGYLVDLLQVCERESVGPKMWTKIHLKPTYEMHLDSALIRIGELALPYYATILDKTTACQSEKVGYIIAKSGSKQQGLIDDLLDKYPLNDNFKVGVSKGILSARDFSPEELLSFMLKLSESNQPGVHLYTANLIGNLGFINDEVVTVIERAFTFGSLDACVHALNSVGELSERFSETQKTSLRPVVENRFEEAIAQSDRLYIDALYRGLFILGGDVSAFLPELKKQLQSQNNQERIDAALSLLALEQDKENAVEVIIDGLRSDQVMWGTFSSRLIGLKQRIAPLVEPLLEEYENAEGRRKDFLFSAIKSATYIIMKPKKIRSSQVNLPEKEREAIRQLYLEHIGILEDVLDDADRKKRFRIANLILRIDSQNEEVIEYLEDCIDEEKIAYFKQQCKEKLENTR